MKKREEIATQRQKRGKKNKIVHEGRREEEEAHKENKERRSAEGQSREEHGQRQMKIKGIKIKEKKK